MAPGDKRKGNGLPKDPQWDPLDSEKEVMCVECQYYWIAVCYEDMHLFECPVCGTMTGKQIRQA